MEFPFFLTHRSKSNSKPKKIIAKIYIKNDNVYGGMFELIRLATTRSGRRPVWVTQQDLTKRKEIMLLLCWVSLESTAWHDVKRELESWAALAKDLDLAPSTHVAAHNHWWLQFQLPSTLFWPPWAQLFLVRRVTVAVTTHYDQRNLGRKGFTPFILPHHTSPSKEVTGTQVGQGLGAGAETEAMD